jgi:putative aminopeptidase FrvX
MIHIDDYAAAKELIVKLVKACDQTTVDTIKANS